MKSSDFDQKFAKKSKLNILIVSITTILLFREERMTDQTTPQTQGQQTGQPGNQTVPPVTNTEGTAPFIEDTLPETPTEVSVPVTSNEIDPLEALQEIPEPQVSTTENSVEPSFPEVAEPISDKNSEEMISSREPEVPAEEAVEEDVEPEPEVVQDVAPISEEELQTVEQQSSLEQLQVADTLDTKLQSDVQKKFGELFFTTKKIYELKTKIGFEEEELHIVGADNDKIFIDYTFLLDEITNPMISITKTEQNKETQEEIINQLKWTYNEETSSLEVMINDTVLFNEVEDLVEDPKNKMQVIDKINKFIFLASEELRKIEKILKEKEEEEQERRSLQEIFRNF